MTDAEQVLWARLRGKQLLDAQFYRQKPIGPYIVDFYCHAAALVIEVDGGQHYETEHARKDSERDKCLADAGLAVMRFDNRQVLLETDAVIEEILRVMHERQIPPGPPLQSGENIKPPSGENIMSPFRKGDSGGFATDPIPHIRS
jgi:very-short-patch-repair endonuclease